MYKFVQKSDSWTANAIEVVVKMSRGIDRQAIVHVSRTDGTNTPGEPSVTVQGVGWHETFESDWKEIAPAIDAAFTEWHRVYGPSR